MKRLNPQNNNTPEMTNDLYQNRWNGELHFIDLPRFQQLASRFTGGKYADLGCFNSPMPMILKQKFKKAEIWAVDHSDVLVKALKQKHPEVNYLEADIMDLPFKDGYFDYIVAGEVIEHMESPQAFVKEAMRVLKRGGTLAISTPYEEGISQPDVSPKEHLWGFTEEDLVELLKPYGEPEVTITQDSFLILTAYVKKTN